MKVASRSLWIAFAFVLLIVLVAATQVSATPAPRTANSSQASSNAAPMALDAIVCYRRSVPLMMTNWTIPLTLPQFDPALGPLTKVTYAVGADLQTQLWVKNPLDRPLTEEDEATTELSVNGTVQVWAPVSGASGRAVVSPTIPKQTKAWSLPAFDGSADFAWPDLGTVTYNASATGAAAFLPGSADFNAFVGTGNVSVTAKATATSSADLPGNLNAQIRTSAALQAVVCYEYSPTTATPRYTPRNTYYKAPAANAAVTTGSGDNNGFQTTPGNAYASDNAYAVDTDSGTGPRSSYTSTAKDRHLFYNYTFGIPLGATILGIEVQLEAKVDSTSGSAKMYVELSPDGGTTWTVAQSTATLAITDTAYTLGGASDLWGRTWTAAELSNATFRARITDVATNHKCDFSLDQIALRVTYR